MQPLRIAIKDFCSHQETEFSFKDFQSALVIGKVKDNDRFSNGAGKSTIFNAIEYVLFNEIHFSSLEKIIRDGCDVCKVELDFISSMDKSIYRITRANSRKTGTDVRLSKQLDNDNWEDLTQRRVSDTEKEIVKIVGFNYKAFCASVLFSQAGSENNVQRDFGNLPALTPEKRKSVLREVLQLNVYGNYEKLAKAKYGSVQSALEKQKIILSTIGDPDTSISLLSAHLEKLEASIIEGNVSLIVAKEKIAAINSEYTSLSEKVLASKTKVAECKLKLNACSDQVLKSEKTVEELSLKIAKLPDEAKIVQEQLEDSEKRLADLSTQPINLEALKEESNIILQNIIKTKSLLHGREQEILELNKPLTSEKVCSNCFQGISEEHRHNWEQVSQVKIQKLLEEISVLELQVKQLSVDRSLVEIQLSNASTSERVAADLKSKIIYLTSDIKSKRNLYVNYVSLLEEHKGLLKEKKLELVKLQEEMTILSASSIDASAHVQIELLKNQIDTLKSGEKDLNKRLSDLIGEEAVVKHKIEISKQDKQKIIQIKKEMENLETSLVLHSKVVQAFGSNGIPALITHSILDELQEEANKWLLKLRPGLQLQFVVVNDKNNKEKEDTLDISYFIDGNEREYKQLSGAQKIIVSLSIKLALLFIINKRLGVDIKILLLDEVDQALDPGSTEVFADIIKIIQDEIKIMVITHDDDLKHKFSHAIMVEQDENNVSKGKLINW
jgi:DNA repair exonuclease SbcCD ATPase subunit